VISAVTASQTVVAAQSCAHSIRKDVFFLDLNSASPGAKTVAAEMIESAGGRFVEGAVMTSVPPYRSKVPMLLGGPHAAALEPALKALGFAPRIGDEKLGVVSATKMCRSVMIKGLEAMVIESFTAARAHGVEDAVIASLHETFPGIDWEKQGSLLSSSASSSTAAAAPRRCARRRRPCARRGWCPGPPPAAPSARPGWRIAPTPASSAGAQRKLRPQPRLAHRGRPHHRRIKDQGHALR
jgi:hypothetical protein